MSIIKKRLLSLALLTLLGLTAVVSMRPALADENLLESQTGFQEINSSYGTTPTDIRSVVAQIIDLALEFLGVIFIVLIIFAGFQYMTSGGNEEKTGAAMSLLRNAIIGLLIILLAWTVTRVTILVLSRTALNNASDPWVGL